MSKKIKGVIQVGDPILRQKAKPILKVDSHIKRLVLKMKDILKRTQGIGLAAPQVGEGLRLIVVGTDNKEWQKELGIDFLALINPEIRHFSREKVIMEEGCLSFADPEIRAEVERPIAVVVEGLDFEGKERKIKAKGLLSRVLQHEIDHLNGVLFTDRANPKTIRTVQAGKEGLNI